MKSILSIAKNLCLVVAAALLVVGSLFISATSASAAEVYTVKMGTDNGMLAFEPAKITVNSGDTVKWVINKVPPHNVVFDGATIPGGSKDLAKAMSHKKFEMTLGDAIELTIPADAPAGEYTYYCEPHRAAGMVGKITVAG